MSKQNQTQKILEHLKSGRPITPLDALMKYGVFRLSARIWELRNEGYDIDQKIVQKNGKRFAEYYMRNKGA